MVSTWGTISWRGTADGGNKIELFTRAGNTETPDDTWSNWSAAYSNPAGTAITSPKARYLQWRAVLTGKGDGPVLTSVTAAYLQRNLRPGGPQHHRASARHRVPEAVHDRRSGTRRLRRSVDTRAQARRRGCARSLAAPPRLGRRTYQKGSRRPSPGRPTTRTMTTSSYDVLFRREGETTWKTLRQGIQETILVWDTTTVPNGTYFVRIVASDAPSNPLSGALTGELDSTEFEIDNTPPTITVGDRARRTRPHDRPLRREGRPFARTARRILSGRPTVARRRSRSTASRIRAKNTTSWRRG